MIIHILELLIKNPVSGISPISPYPPYYTITLYSNKYLGDRLGDKSTRAGDKMLVLTV